MKSELREKCFILYVSITHQRYIIHPTTYYLIYIGYQPNIDTTLENMDIIHLMRIVVTTSINLFANVVAFY